MSLTEEQTAGLEGVLTETEVRLSRCEEQLLRQDEAAQELLQLWDQASSIVTPDSDEWRMLDRKRREQTEWWLSTTSGYVERNDCKHFAKLRQVLRQTLEQSEPEFLRAQKRRRSQHFFAAGEEYEAIKAIFTAMKAATSSLAIVDEYLDEMVFDYIESLDPGVELKLLTGQHKPIFKTLLVPFALRRGKVEAKICVDCHDRFLLIDRRQAVHLGASINYAGRKAFMMNEVTEPAEFTRLMSAFDTWWAVGKPIA